MNARQTVCVALMLAACGTPEPEAPPAPPLVQPLAKATVAPWRQRVWFTARPGEKVEQLRLSEGADAHPVVSLVAADGSRRAVTLLGPGEVAPAQVVVRPDDLMRRTASTPDGGIRVAIDVEDEVTITLTDTRKGGGRRVVLRDLGTRRIGEPVVSPDGHALFFEEAGDLGGIYRVNLSGDGVVRVVPERAARSARVWPGERGERIVYVEAGEVDRVLVAVPLGSTPPRPAGEVLAEGRFPPSITPVVATFDGSPLRVGSCTPTEPTAFSATGAGVVKVDGLDYAGFESAQFCGRGCSELLGRSPEGALRVTGVLSHRVDAGVWDVWFDNDVGAPSGTFADTARAHELVEVPSCLEPRASASWIVEPRYTAPVGHELLYYTQASDGTTAANTLRVFGNASGRSFLVTMTPGGLPLHHWVLQDRVAPPAVATTLAGDATVALTDGGIAWTEVATGATSMILPASPTRTLRDPVLSANDTLLWVVDDGDEPGLRRISVEQGTLDNVLPWSGLHHPKPMRIDGIDRVAWLREVGGRWSAGTLLPFDERLEAAWNAGPITMLDFQADWVPVRVSEGRMERCESPDIVRFGVDAEGGFLSWGAVRAPVRAAVEQGDALLLLGELEGVPSVVAELRVEGDRATWWPRAMDVPRTAGRWAPASQAMHLPVAAPCDPRRD